MPSFDPMLARRDIPALRAESVVYLDNAATTQKPDAVIQRLHDFYAAPTGNVHRASHQWSVATSQDYEAARKTVADFLHVNSNEIVFTRGATEAINLIAYSYGMANLQAGDEIIISELEHHANIVPWQLVAQKTGATIIPWRVQTPLCQLSLAEFEKLLSARTKIVAISHISNVTATRNPIEQVIEKAHAAGAVVVVDGAQGIVHERLDLQAIDADFYVFSGHKLYAPTGIGALFAKQALLEAMPPWQGGGKMVERVSFSGTQFSPAPARFEAGTPNTAGALALAAAIDWLAQFDAAAVERHIHHLQQQLVAGLAEIDGMELIGLQKSASVVAFRIQGIHGSDLATLLDNQGVAIRAGKHCAHPLMEALGIDGCLRISIALYTTEDDIKRCISAIHRACALL